MFKLRGQPLVACMVVSICLGIASCHRTHNEQAVDVREPIRLSGVAEPAELLIPPQKAVQMTPEIKAMSAVFDGMKSGEEVKQLPAVDAYVSKFPDVGDMYVIRIQLRCTKRDLSGAGDDIGKVLTGKKWIMTSNQASDIRELRAIRAKLSFLSNNDEAALQDVRWLIDSYSEDIQYLTDGRVKPGDQANSVCAWTPDDLSTLVQRTHHDPSAFLFQGIFYAAFAPLDDASKKLSEADLSQAIAMSPHSAAAYFYAAVGAQKAAAFKQIAFTEQETSQFNRRLIDLYSKAIEINSQVGAAYAARANAYLNESERQKAIADFDQAIGFEPDNSGLWNDRGLAKAETYDQNGAVEDTSRAIELDLAKGDTDKMLFSIEQRGDLYMKLGNFKKALADYTTLIGGRMEGALLFMNLDFFRQLYPEYARVDDAHLRQKLRKMYYPNFSEDTFEKEMDKPEGMHPKLDAQLPEAYLKRADALMALKDFHAASVDYIRAQRFPNQRAETERWRKLVAMPKFEVDLQTIDTRNPENETAWVRSAESTNPDSFGATEYNLDCGRRSVRIGRSTTPIDPPPGSPAESVRDYFCPSR